MSNNDILTRFNEGITWNGLTYLVYKILTTAVTFLLFAQLSTNNFVTWTSLQSLIYLTLLWLDFGLRKSIPRYLPLLEQYQLPMQVILKIFFMVYGFLLLCSAVLLVYYGPQISHFLHITYNYHVFILTGMLVCLEGMVAVIRLIFHAQFKNKAFNIMSTLLLGAESSLVVVLIIGCWPITVVQLFLIRIMTSSSIIFGTE